MDSNCVNSFTWCFSYRTLAFYKFVIMALNKSNFPKIDLSHSVFVLSIFCLFCVCSSLGLTSFLFHQSTLKLYLKTASFDTTRWRYPSIFFTVSCFHKVLVCGPLNLNTAVCMFVLNPLTAVDAGMRPCGVLGKLWGNASVLMGIGTTEMHIFMSYFLSSTKQQRTQIICSETEYVWGH